MAGSPQSAISGLVAGGSCAACQPHGATRLSAPSVPVIPAPLGNESWILPLGRVGPLLQSSQGFVASSQIHTISLRRLWPLQWHLWVGVSIITGW